jgi:acetate kinase
VTANEPVILTLNGGSSSLKFSVARMTSPPERLVRGSVSDIAGKSPKLSVSFAGGNLKSQPVHAADHAHAAQAVLTELAAYAAPQRIALVAHRVVHGGKSGDRARRVTPELIDELRALSPLDPDHLPAELALIEAARSLAPNADAVCCFDSAFHRTLPRVARLLAIPREYAERGVTRYGFHGLSYAFLLKELAHCAGQPAARGRVILAHLGAGASLCAVRDGRCMDTTMGFTPTSGVPMATRSGDVDPGALLWLLREGRLSVDALDDLLNHRSGLLGVSGISGDVRELLEREAREPAAAEALALFCYHVRKAIGALATAIGGVDTLVFSGGIGEHSQQIRARCTQGLEYLGIVLDEQRNGASAAIISANRSACAVRVIATDEESVLAEQALAAIELDPHPASEVRE